MFGFMILLAVCIPLIAWRRQACIRDGITSAANLYTTLLWIFVVLWGATFLLALTTLLA